MKGNVLIVDDDPMIRDVVKSILESESYLVTSAEDGSQAISYLENPNNAQGLSFVVLDVIMPGVNGLDVLTRMRLNPHTQNLPVLMLTGEDKAEDILSGYNVGANYYITKPFTRQQLLYGIKLVLDQTTP